jgi:hypothetical protein
MVMNGAPEVTACGFLDPGNGQCHLKIKMFAIGIEEK